VNYSNSDGQADPSPSPVDYAHLHSWLAGGQARPGWAGLVSAAYVPVTPVSMLLAALLSVYVSSARLPRLLYVCLSVWIV